MKMNSLTILSLFTAVFFPSFCLAQEARVEASTEKIDTLSGSFSDASAIFSSDGEEDYVKSTVFTLGYEGALSEHGMVKNRNSFRVEYAKFFWESFYFSLDTKLNAYWAKDYQANGRGKKIHFDTNTQAAFLQYSTPGGSTSIRAGMQRLIWGESEGGAITDIVSPRNGVDLFFIPLDESRISQFMVNADYFSSIGDWSAFFIPSPKMNKSPDRSSIYYVDPFDGQARVYHEPNKEHDYEYGMTWKKTLGRSDVTFMTARLMDNDYFYRGNGIDGAGALQVSRFKQRLSMFGTTFNYVTDRYLLKGEIALKSPKVFNDANMQVIRRDVVDSSIGLTYSLKQSDTIGFELVNSYVNNWDERIINTQRNMSSVVLNTYFESSDGLSSISWLTTYSWPHSSVLSSARMSHKWSDNLTLGFDIHLIVSPASNSSLYYWRDHSQIVFRGDYKF